MPPTAHRKRFYISSLSITATLLLLALLITLWPRPAFAATIAVSGQCTLVDAITAANTDSAVGNCTAGHLTDTLLLSPTTYSLTAAPYDLDGATATPDIVTTIIISGGTGATIERSGSAHYRLFHIGSAGNLTLQKVTVRNGNLSGNGNGGAIFNDNQLTLIDSALVANRADNGGALVNHQISNATLINSSILSNTALAGGGILNDLGSTLHLSTSHLISNSATGSGENSGGGGGILNQQNSTFNDSGSDYRLNWARAGAAIGNQHNSVAALTASQLLSNTANESGGALFATDSGTTTMTNVTIAGNRALFGGGLYNEDQSLLALIGTTLHQNQAQQGGALANVQDSEASVRNSLFTANRSSGPGGALFNSNSSQATFANSNLIANQAAAGNGGALYNELISSLSISAGKILSNTALGDGGGLYNHTFSTATITGTELAANRAGRGGAIFNHGNAITVRNVRFINNHATRNGGAFAESQGASLVDQSCISGNSNVAFFDLDATDGNILTAAHNWWGAPDGPSSGPGGAATGEGDSVSAGVLYQPFLTSPILGCSSRSLALSISAQPAHAQVGQTITYTYRLTNTGSIALTVATATDSHLGDLGELQHTNSPAQSATLTRTHIATTNDPPQLANTLRVATRPATGANNEFTRTATVTVSITGGLGQPGLALSVQPSVSQAHVGDLITYTVRITNTGEVALQSIRITDTVLHVTLNVGALAAGTAATRTYTHTANSTDGQAGQINNALTATAVDNTGRAVNANASAHVTILPKDGDGDGDGNGNDFTHHLNLPFLKKAE